MARPRQPFSSSRRFGHVGWVRRSFCLLFCVLISTLGVNALRPPAVFGFASMGAAGSMGSAAMVTPPPPPDNPAPPPPPPPDNPAPPPPDNPAPPPPPPPDNPAPPPPDNPAPPPP